MLDDFTRSYVETMLWKKLRAEKRKLLDNPYSIAY